MKSAESPHSHPIQVKVRVDECIVRIEVDTGAAMSLISEATFSMLWPGRVLQSSQVHLQSYSKGPIPVVGGCKVKINYQGQIARLPLLIVVIGRDWLSKIRLNWQQIYQVDTTSLQAVRNRYPAVFQQGLGTLKGYQAKIYVDPNAVPRFRPPRPVLYALRDKVDKELKRFQDDGRWSQWK